MNQQLLLLPFAAHELHTEPSVTHISLVGHATLAVAKGVTRKIDVIEYMSEEEHIFALVSHGTRGGTRKAVRAARGQCRACVCTIPFIADLRPCSSSKSMFGWGLAGAVSLKADQLRWLPGQKKARYDIAGAVTLLAVSSHRRLLSCACLLFLEKLLFSAAILNDFVLNYLPTSELATAGRVYPVLSRRSRAS